MVNELIELSRVETGKADLKVEPIVLNILVTEVISHLKTQAERKQIAIIDKLEETLPAVQADAEKLQQVITNIVHNAIKFTPAGGKSRLRIK